VVFDQFSVDGDRGKMIGLIEIVDGRWAASLGINLDLMRNLSAPPARRPVPLLLYDLWNDPFCLNSIHEERPDLVERYTNTIRPPAVVRSP
jgi:hypothetical protein